MMGINLFGTCTMKYNPRVGEAIAARPEIAAAASPPARRHAAGRARDHPRARPDPARALGHGPVRLPGRRRRGRRLHPRLRDARLPRGARRARRSATRSSRRSRRTRATRRPPRRPASRSSRCTLEEDGYPSLDALQAAVSDRTAALMVNNPDDMGIYNPHIKEWVEIVHEAGGLCFYDHANFNGVMSKIRARELGFDACMFMLHKTFGAPKGGGGPAGRRLRLHGGAGAVPARRRSSARRRRAIALDATGRESIGKVREFFGQRPADREGLRLGARHGRRGHRGGLRPLGARQQLHGGAAARDPRRDQVAPAIRRARRMEMTRYSLGPLTEETGVRCWTSRTAWSTSASTRFWLSHEPWVVPRAVHAGGGRDVVARGHRLLDRRARARLRRGLHAIPSSCGPRRTTRRSTSSTTPALERPGPLGDDLARRTSARTRAPQPASPEPCAPRLPARGAHPVQISYEGRPLACMPATASRRR